MDLSEAYMLVNKYNFTIFLFIFDLFNGHDMNYILIIIYTGTIPAVVANVAENSVLFAGK